MSIGSYAHFSRTAPQQTDGDTDTWYHRSANMVASHSVVKSGSVLKRPNNVDEYFVWALFTPCTVSALGETVEVPAGSIVVVPPGESWISFAQDGTVWRGFTTLNNDLLELAGNHDEYRVRPEGLAPIDAWPMPVGGYKIRVYDLSSTPSSKPHIYRHRTAMTNVPWPIAHKPRALDTMSPHTHEDFEQVSIIHSGTMIHHMRRAWSRNLNDWLPDEHEILTAPAIAISKPPDVHTTQAVSAGEAVGLMDYFSPPRWDFSNVGEMVVNHDDYPIPAEAPPSYARVAEVYAASVTQAALKRKA